MNDRSLASVVLGLASIALLSTSGIGLTAAPTTTSTERAFPTGSWALGVVVPEGATLQGGGKLRWDQVTNVTGVVTLPEISSPGGIVYAVLSVMTSDNAVLQVAAGARPNGTFWLVYSWFIPDSGSIPVRYVWLLNGSQPVMDAGSRISLSLFLVSGEWRLRVENLDTGASIEDPFPSGVAPGLRPGDQEVFALESYSRAQSTFQSMGNMTLESLTFDGERATGGFYFYGEWSLTRNPLFAVGAAGGSPPYFVTLQEGNDGSLVWCYDAVWNGEGGGGFAVVLTVALLSMALSIAGGVILLTKRRRGTR